MDYQKVLQKYQVILATQYSVVGILIGYFLSKSFELTNIFWSAVIAIPLWFIFNGVRQRIENELETLKLQVDKL